MIKALQIFWGLGITAWNAYGMYQIQQGGPTPGPTSSWLVAGVGILIAVVFGFNLLRGNKWLYILFCLVCSVLAFVAVYGAFTQDPALWPSEAWRWGGVVLNGIGLFACLAGIIASLKGREQA